MRFQAFRKWIAFVFLMTGFSTICWSVETPKSLNGVKVVSATEVKKMLESGVLVVDTRVPVEFAEKSIKGAKNIPYKELSAKDVVFDASKDSFDLSKLPSDKSATIVLFCNAGECWKSYKASVVALKAGYTKLCWFRGGFPEWVAAGFPVQ
ncbi:rhodanese-like domain-containing protein [Undibacterium sp. Di24W]|uniref:rhodanese-like domain-containing protein n=1 Tax=Undibacterium sp. Di24W TaxID=3413033 RepID=UPI003BF1C2C8